VTAAVGGTVRAAVEAATARLASAGVDTAAVDAAWLLAGALGVGRAALATMRHRELDDATAARYEAMVSRRARREPLQQILGWEEFYGLRVAVTPDVLVPRPETEILVEWALALLPPRPALAIDVGTGSGCIACALAAGSPTRVLAIDASPAAAAVARRNVRALGLDGRVILIVADLFGGLDRVAADLIVSNPPYLSRAMLRDVAPEISAYEPALALDGGGDGLRVIRRLVNAAPAHLSAGGWLVLETAGPSQATEVRRLMCAAGLREVSTRRDLTGTERFVAGRR
jgi:release factor glutamine methyltransferase